MSFLRCGSFFQMKLKFKVFIVLIKLLGISVQQDGLIDKLSILDKYIRPKIDL